MRHELQRSNEYSNRGEHGEPAQLERQGQQRQVEPFQHTHDQIVSGFLLATHEQRAQDGHDGERDDERRQHGKAHRGGQGLEHLAFHLLECEQGQEHDDDDQYREDDGPGHLANRLVDDGRARRPGRASLRQMPRDILGNHDRRIHDHPYGDGQPAEAHEVGGDALPAHEDEGHKRGKREGKGHDHRRPEVAQEHEEDNDDKDASLHERVPHRFDAGLNERGSVVERVDLDASRQALLDLRDGCLDAVHDDLRVLAGQHDGHAGDRFAFAVASQCALAGRVAHFDFGHVLQEDGGAVIGLEHDVLDVGNALDEAHRAHVRLFPGFDDEVTAGIGVVVSRGLDYILQRDAILQE